MKKKKDTRLYFLAFILLVSLSGVITRLFSLQVLSHSRYEDLAKNQHQLFEKLFPKRGSVFLKDKSDNLYPLAINKDYPVVYAVPTEIEDANLAAERLAESLKIPKEKLFELLDKPDDPYELLARKISPETLEKIKELAIKGIYLSFQSDRWYPQGALASHVLGFLGYQGDRRVGQYGLEGYYDEELAGEPGILMSQRDAFGRWIWSSEQDFQPPNDGDSLVLTIDQNIQFAAETKLKELKEKWQAEGGSIIIMEPTTGAILAMSSWPDFDPDNYSEVENIDVFLNPATQKVFEPGSIFKPITMAAGLDTGEISPETTYVDEGFVKIGGYTITNAVNRAYGLSSMNKVLEKSINTGAVFVQQKIGQRVFREYVEAFGIKQPTGIDLIGEVAGNINNLRADSPEINFATASFGQGISVTPLGMATAIAAIANEGKLMRPFLVSKTIKPDGQEIVTQPQVVSQVITSRTANTLTAMLVNTVRKGYDKLKVGNYFVAGKTGTAQIPDPEGRGYITQTIHSFVGYAPAFDPKFLIFLKIDKPKGINFASDSLSLAFSEMTRYLLNYYEIAPEE